MNNPSPSDLQARLARLAAHFAIPEREEEAPRLIGPEAVEAREVIGRRGRYWQRSIGYSPREPWGETQIETACEACLREGLRIPFNVVGERIPLAECLFIDCETTGLSGGAGTVAFLIAVGQFDGESFVVDQYFLPDLADEAGALDEIAARFESAAAIVSYNGASFDLPLLEGRFNFWRIDPSFRELPHLDLLWPTRAVFKHRIVSCSLATVEEQILKIARVEDLPGAQVPEVYFEYLRSGFSPRLHAVFEHNRLDVVSLFVYALWLDHRTHPMRPSLDSPDDLQALARYWYRHRRHDPALRALDEATTGVLDQDQRSSIHRLRGHILKRDRDFETAHEEWRKAAEFSPGDCSVAEELAKHLEHRRRDFAGALNLVQQAIAALEFRSMIGDSNSSELRQRLIHRQTRLRRKLTMP
jgi:uncharacterized protein YprB with RNaseH-like and TPR domain